MKASETTTALTVQNCPLYLLDNGRYNKLNHPTYGIIVIYGDVAQMKATPNWREQLLFTQAEDGSWFCRLPKQPQYTVAAF